MADIKLKNLRGAYYIAPDGSIVADNKTTPKDGSISIVVDPSDDDSVYDLVTIVFPDNVQVEAYSAKKNVGKQSGTVMALLKSLWVSELSEMNFDESEDKLFVDCALAADEGDIDNGAVTKIVDKFKEARKEHNALCKPKDSDDDSDSDDGSDSDDSSDSDKQKQKQKKQPQKRAPRKDNESASGQTLEFVDRDQADRDTHATLVAIGGEEFARNFNGLIWDEASQTYKDA